LVLDLLIILLVVAVWRSLRQQISSPVLAIILAGAGAALFSLPILVILRPRRPIHMEAIRLHGLPAQAVILQNRYYNNLHTYHGPEVVVELRVHLLAHSGAEYEGVMYTPISSAGSLPPGAQVQVKYMPDDPLKIVLD
jgi:hypothetical protein